MYCRYFIKNLLFYLIYLDTHFCFLIFLFCFCFLFIIAKYFFPFFCLPPPRLDFFSICEGTLNVKPFCIVDVFLIESQIKGVKENQGPTQGVCFAEVSIFNLKCLLRKSQL